MPVPISVRRGFTLMELLVVIMVIAVLASSMLFAMYHAVQQAKESRTKVQIAKLHELLMTRWDSYRTRAIRLQGLPPLARRDARAVATARLLALRELMRLELPDRREDVVEGTAVAGVNLKVPYLEAGSLKTATVYITRPACNREYARRVGKIGGVANWSETYQDSECLYMIIASMQDITGNALDFFQEAEIGDTDGDRMPEILDAWGKPIAFIRWPAGFVEHPGPDFTFGTVDDIPSYSNLHVVDPVGSSDPFDPLRVDTRPPPPAMTSPPWPAKMDPDGAGTAEYQFGFALYPLVVSGGPDEALDIVRFDFDPDGDHSVQIPFNYYRTGNNPYLPAGWPDALWPNDPYSVMPTCKRRLAEPFLESDGYKDNITNHGLGG